MSVAGFLADLRQRQVVVTADGDQLRCSGPPGVLTDELLGVIRDRKAELLAHLSLPRREGTPPLSYAQERFWLLHQFDPGDTAYHLPLEIRLGGPLDPNALRQALGQVVRRHDVLRTTYLTRRGRPEPVINPFVTPELPVTDLTGLADPEDACRELAEAEARRPFDLATGPVLRARLVRLRPDEHALLITRHHIASDGWSLGVLLTELGSLYEAHTGGKPGPLVDPPVRYGDFAAWQRAAADDDVAHRWHRLVGAPAGADILADAEPGAARGPAGIVRAALDATPLKEWAVRDRITLFSVLLTGYGLVLSGLSGQRDLVVGSPVAGRSRPDLDGLIGCFVTMLPLRLDLSGSCPAGELVRRVQEVVREGLTAQDVPFERIVEVLRPERSLDENPLFQVAFAFQNVPDADVRLSGITASVRPSPAVAPKFPLTLTATERDGTIDLDLEFDSHRLAPELAREILRRLREVLAVAAADPRVPITQLMGTAATAQPQPETPVAESTLTRQVGEVVAATPDAVAITHGGEHVTYRALQERADRVAAALRARGVGPDTVVGLCVEPSVDLVVGALGVLRAGGAYLPLDPGDPAHRLRAVAQEAGLRLVVTRSGQQVPPVDRLDLDDLGDLGEAARRGVEPHPANLAYVIHTSGSTGTPKGVAISHAAVTGLLAACRAALPLTARPCTWALTHSAAFDFSVWEMWGALTSGGHLVIVPPDVVREPDAFWDTLRAHRVAVLGQTPSACRHLLPTALATGPHRSALELVVLGGEACEVATFAPWFDAVGDSGPELVNMYGITETTVHVTARPLRARDVTGRARSPIGGPLPGQHVTAVDPAGNPVPVGGRGELVVGGVGVARGYRGLPALTAEKFRPDPARPGARRYLSGDLARVLPGGDLDYQGRLDAQVKVRGYRVEPGEVEAALLAHTSVRACVVVPKVGAAGTYLAAYVVGEHDRAELRAFAAERLPRHMVPSAFVFIDRIPLTRNGKLDVAALQEPAAAHRPESRPPNTATERRIAAILAAVLELPSAESLGAHDNFFDLGGDSLLLIQFHARVVDAFGIDMPVRRVYQALDVAALASTVDTYRAEAEQDLLLDVLREVEAMTEEDA